MRLIPCQSSSLAGIGYDGEDCIVQFSNGKVYRYSGVPAEVVTSVLFSSESQGKAFNAKIKGGIYPVQEITDPEELNLHV